MPNKKMTILIPNATGPTNVGDQTILKGLLRVLKNTYKNAEIIIHSSENLKYQNFPYKNIKPTLYSWAILDDVNPIRRIYRLMILLINYVLFKFSLPAIGPKNLKNIIRDFRKANLIIFVGGGYFRSQKGLTQSLNLSMLLFIFKFASLTNVKKILGPASFGPFIHPWQENFAASTLKSLDVIFAREIFTFNALKKHGIEPFLTTDSGLFLPMKKHKKNNKFVIGFTTRNWLTKNKQSVFESEVAKSILQFAKKTGAIVQPIVHVDAPKYGDFDREVTRRVADQIQKEGVKILKPVTVKSLDIGLDIYSKIDMLLGMRMHSNIMAALAGTPFVALAYEYKTEGICKTLGVGKYVVNVQDANSKKILVLLNDLHKNYSKVAGVVYTNLEKLQKEEMELISKSLLISQPNYV